jgi:MFS superfamily sulfate permease-like transporter
LSIFFVILANSAATSRAYAVKYSESFDENVDLVGLGLANVAAGLSGTFAVNGSPTKTEIVDSAGGRSQIAQITTAFVVVIVLLFLTGPLAYMPNAVLSAVVFYIGVRLIAVRGMARIYRLALDEFVVAAITALVVVEFGVEQGIILAIVRSVRRCACSHANRSLESDGGGPKPGGRPGAGRVPFRRGPLLRQRGALH